MAKNQVDGRSEDKRERFDLKRRDGSTLHVETRAMGAEIMPPGGLLPRERLLPPPPVWGFRTS